MSQVSDSNLNQPNSRAEISEYPESKFSRIFIYFLRFQLMFVSFFLLSVGLQLWLFPLIRGVMVIDTAMTISVFIFFGVIYAIFSINIEKGLFYYLNIFLELFTLLLAYAMNIFLFSPFNALLNIATIFLYMTSWTALIFYMIIGIHTTAGKRGLITIGKDTMNFGVKLKKLVIKQVTKPKKIAYLGVFAFLLTILIGSFFNWGYTIKVRAPDGFKTISSYWGPPADDRVSVTREITPINNNTLFVSNSTLNQSVDNMGNGSFCYATSVHIKGDTKNYCNYTAGAESFPNGTIILSEPLPQLNNVVIEFTYRYNIDVFKVLGETNATLIINYLNEGDDFINYTNIFMRIQRTYLFQLFDYWKIKYYLDVGLSSLSFPNIFNYKPFVDFANRTISWASKATVGENGPKALTYMVGISADFESSDANVSAYNPERNYNIQPPIPLISYNDWISINEQNETLYREAVNAWENVYSYCSKNGFKFYAVFQTKAVYDTIDNDLDISRLPTFPISKNKDVLYGIMNYKDSKFDGGRYAVYEDAINQIKLYGDQGKTLLMGWIQKGTKYYTDDEEGLERYIDDCLIAQAAGMVEIFHAPLYRMQGKWGNSAILKLHQALNEEPKKTFVLKAKTMTDFDRELMVDYIKNWNHVIFAIPLWAGGIFVSSLAVYIPIKKESRE
ncbi:MAG: hypothetical protein ACTSU2_06100 [Promethearchaeota archaeon]